MAGWIDAPMHSEHPGTRSCLHAGYFDDRHHVADEAFPLDVVEM